MAPDGEACAACGRLYVAVPCPGDRKRDARGQCAVCGVPVCREHGPDKGRAYLCDQHAEIPVIEGWAQVYSTSTDLDAELVRDNLQAEGMDARVLSQKDHFFAPVAISSDSSPVRVLVPVYGYLEARDILRGHTPAGGDVQFACGACGEPYEEDQDVCASCGEVLA